MTNLVIKSNENGSMTLLFKYLESKFIKYTGYMTLLFYYLGNEH